MGAKNFTTSVAPTKNNDDLNFVQIPNNQEPSKTWKLKIEN